MMTSGQAGDEDKARQDVHSVGGFAYGVVGADLHVFADRGPVYLLRQHRPAATPDPAWLVRQPSRMLDARHAIVGFVGRDRELEVLTRWRDAGGSRLSARWLHAPGGQGKTRLAGAFARLSDDANWKVIIAMHGLGVVHPPPGSEDLRHAGAAGVLLIVDYADRWPVSHLAWLFSNALLHQPCPARLLLIARTTHGWPAVRAALDSQQAETADLHLEPLPDDRVRRQEMYRVARDAFSGQYGIDPAAVEHQSSLDDPDFGLTLAVHMAALVDVDAAVHGLRAPSDMAGLSAYLLDRERRHWCTLYENRTEGLEFGTAPGVIARTTFTAALTGAVGHQDGTVVLRTLDVGADPQRALTDHAMCYPPADPAQGTVLEPLYPDRLAEDFLALCMPGHDLTGYPADPWCIGAPADLLEAEPGHAPRAVTFLTAAAARWPHLATQHLYPLLRRNPALAVRAGSAALSTLADLPGVPAKLLESVDARFPAEPDVDLDPGIAAVTCRLAEHQLAATDNPLIAAEVRDRLARRLFRAGRYEEALQVAQHAVADWRQLAGTFPAVHQPGLTTALVNLATHLRLMGREVDALAPAEEALALAEQLAAADPLTYESGLAGVRNIVSVARQAAGQHDGVTSLSQRSIESYRRLAATDPQQYEPELARALLNLAIHYRNIGQMDDAAACSREAVDINRRLCAAQPAAYRPNLAQSLNTLGNVLVETGHADLAMPIGEEAVEVHRKLVAINPDAYEHDLALALSLVGNCRQVLGQLEQALAPTEEAVDICRRLTARNAAAYEWTLATALDNLGARLTNLSLVRQIQPSAAAVDYTEEAVRIFRRLAAANPGRFERDFARGLGNLAARLMDVGRLDEALAVAREGLALRRRLAEENPAVHRFLLGSDMAGLATILVARGEQLDEAARILEEAIGIYREAVPANPAEIEPQLARWLLTLALTIRHMPGEQEHARRAVSEAVNILGRYRDRRPEFFQVPLEGALRLQRELGAPSGDIEVATSVSFEQAALGATIPITIPGTTRILHVRLPAAVADQQRIRIRGRGAPDPAGSIAGDLYVTVTVEPHPIFRRDGDNLTLTIPVTSTEAVRGAIVEVPVLEDRSIKVRIPEATPPGRRLRARHHGCRRADGTRGDLLIRVNIVPGASNAAAMRTDLFTAATRASKPDR